MSGDLVSTSVASAACGGRGSVQAAHTAASSARRSVLKRATGGGCLGSAGRSRGEALGVGTKAALGSAIANIGRGEALGVGTKAALGSAIANIGAVRAEGTKATLASATANMGALRRGGSAEPYGTERNLYAQGCRGEAKNIYTN